MRYHYVQLFCAEPRELRVWAEFCCLRGLQWQNQGTTGSANFVSVLMFEGVGWRLDMNVFNSSRVCVIDMMCDATAVQRDVPSHAWNGASLTNTACLDGTEATKSSARRTFARDGFVPA